MKIRKNEHEILKEVARKNQENCIYMSRYYKNEGFVRHVYLALFKTLMSQNTYSSLARQLLTEDTIFHNSELLEEAKIKLKNLILDRDVASSTLLLKALEESLGTTMGDEIKFYKAKIHQISGSFTKAAIILDDLLDKESPYRYVHHTHRLMCKMKFSGIHKIVFPSDEKSEVLIYEATSKYSQELESIIKREPNKATDAYYILAIIYLMGEDREKEFGKPYFEKVLENIEELYNEEYTRMHIKEKINFYSAYSILKNGDENLQVVSERIRESITGENIAPFPNYLWKKMTTQLEAYEQNHYIEEIYNLIKDSILQNKNHILSNFSGKYLAGNNAHTELKLYEIAKIAEFKARTIAIREFLKEHSEFQSETCRKAIITTANYAQFESSVSRADVSSLISLLFDLKGLLKPLFDQNEYEEILIDILPHSQESEQKTNQINYIELLLENLRSKYESRLSSEFINEIVSHFPEIKNDSRYKALIDKLPEEKTTREVEAKIMSHCSTCEINLLWVGGDNKTKKAFECGNNIQSILDKRFNGKIKFIDTMYCYTNTNHNFTLSNLKENKELLAKADIVFVHRRSKHEITETVPKLAGQYFLLSFSFPF